MWDRLRERRGVTNLQIMFSIEVPAPISPSPQEEINEFLSVGAEQTTNDEKNKHVDFSFSFLYGTFFFAYVFVRIRAGVS